MLRTKLICKAIVNCLAAIVAAVGLTHSGAIYIGVNLEFRGLPLFYSVHGEVQYSHCMLYFFNGFDVLRDLASLDAVEEAGKAASSVLFLRLVRISLVSCVAASGPVRDLEMTASMEAIVYTMKRCSRRELRLQVSASSV